MHTHREIIQYVHAGAGAGVLGVILEVSYNSHEGCNVRHVKQMLDSVLFKTGMNHFYFFSNFHHSLNFFRLYCVKKYIHGIHFDVYFKYLTYMWTLE